MGKIIWTEPALKDLQDIVTYIANDSPRYAERLAFRIVEDPKRLQEFPLSGRIVPEFDNPSVRELIYGSYRIIYLIKENHCYITAIIHASRDIVENLKPGEWIIN